VNAYTIDTAPVEVLRREYKQLLDRHQEGKDDRHVGWWIRQNAAHVVIVTHLDKPIVTTGKDVLQAIAVHMEREARDSAWRAA